MYLTVGTTGKILPRGGVHFKQELPRGADASGFLFYGGAHVIAFLKEEDMVGCTGAIGGGLSKLKKVADVCPVTRWVGNRRRVIQTRKVANVCLLT